MARKETPHNEQAPDQRTSRSVYVRLNVQNVTSRKPVSHMPVRVTAVSGDKRQQLLTSATDLCGFFSIELPYEDLSGFHQIEVSSTTDDSINWSKPLRDLLAENVVQNWDVPQEFAEQIVQSHISPATAYFPDGLTAILSPASLGYLPNPRVGAGLCDQLTPTSLTPRKFRAVAFEIDRSWNSTLSMPVDDMSLRRGRVKIYDVIWKPLGHSLGELINAFSLAPCEQVKIGVSSFNRLSRASRSETTKQTQTDFLASSKESNIVETMKGCSETDTDSSTGAMSVMFPIDAINVGFTVGSSSGSHDIESTASAVQKLSQLISSSATSVISRNSLTVFESSDIQTHAVQTRTIRNNNHCHTLTYMYFQLNERFLVSTRYIGTRDVFFLAQSIEDFKPEEVVCLAHYLRRGLLDQSLATCFDELADSIYCSGSGGGIQRTNLVRVLIQGAKQFANRPLHITIRMQDGSILTSDILGWNDTHNQSTIDIPAYVDPQSIVGIELSVMSNAGDLGSPDMANVSHLTVQYAVDGSTNFATIFEKTYSPNQLIQDSLPYAARIEPGHGMGGLSNCCANKLMAHLNCNKAYYRRLIWESKSPSEWTDELFNGMVGSEFVVDYWEMKPIGTIGNLVAFVDGSVPIDPDPVTPPVHQVVTLPTQGMFSEAILGNCSACEVKDASRFSEWTCSDSAPDLTFSSPKDAPDLSSILTPDAITDLITLSQDSTASSSVFSAVLSSLIAEVSKGTDGAATALGTLLEALGKAMEPKEKT